MLVELNGPQELPAPEATSTTFLFKNNTGLRVHDIRIQTVGPKPKDPKASPPPGPPMKSAMVSTVDANDDPGDILGSDGHEKNEYHIDLKDPGIGKGEEFTVTIHFKEKPKPGEHLIFSPTDKLKAVINGKGAEGRTSTD